MRTRDKILLLLLAITLAFGAVLYLRLQDDQDSLFRFRWLVLNHPLQHLAQAISTADVDSPAGGAALWYGGLSLFGIILVGIAFRAAGNAERRVFQERLVNAEVAKAELETSLQDALWKEKHARSGREAAVRDLEEISSRMLDLEDQLQQTARDLKRREAELKSRGPEKITLPSTDEKILNDKLRHATELLHSKEAELTELQNTSGQRITELQAQLTVKNASLDERERQLRALKSEVAQLESVRHEAEGSLSAEVMLHKQAREAQEAAMRELERRLTARIRDAEAQRAADQDRLQTRSTEIETLISEVDLLKGQLATAVSAKQRADASLEQEIKNRGELLNAKDRAFEELQRGSTAAIETLRTQLEEQRSLAQETAKQLEALRAEFASAGTAKSSQVRLLAEELSEVKQAREAQAAAMKEREANLAATVESLTARLKEREGLFQICANDLEAAKSEINLLSDQTAELASAKERAEHQLAQELKHKTELLQAKDAAFNDLQSKLGAAMRNFEDQIQKKDDDLQKRAAELHAAQTALLRLNAVQQETEEGLLNDLRDSKEMLLAKDRAVKELQAHFARSADETRKQLAEQQQLLNVRDRELEELRSEFDALQIRLSASQAAAAAAEADDRGATAPDTAAAGQQKSAALLQSTLRETEDLLKIRDEKIQRLETELKEKRTELAKHEIAVWQAYERRALWKQRLAKFGISMKD